MIQLGVMDQLPASITITVALLTAFCIAVVVVKYAIEDTFVKTRLGMTAFFLFVVATLTISFWQYTMLTLPYSTPALGVGILVGYLVGVRTAEQKLRSEGLTHYMRHFAHIHFKNMGATPWWVFINFYTVMSGLVLVNLVGLSTVIFRGSTDWAIVTSAMGAFLVGTIVPYIIHLWSIRTPHSTSTTRSE